MKNWPKVYIFIIILSSLVTHFIFFGHPNETVFDEVHFGKFISGYFTGEYFFDIHPPLGKLLISGMGYLAGFKPGFSFTEIGQKFPDNTYFWLRLLPTLAGVLLPLIIFFLVLRLGLSRLAAFSTAMLVVFENGLLVQSRFILLDPFLLLLGFSALLFYFIYTHSNNKDRNLLVPLNRNCDLMEQVGNSGQTRYLVLAGIFGALSASVKWTGATFLAIIIILEAARFHFYLRSHLKANLKAILTRVILPLIALPFIIYFSVFAVHLSLLTKSGPGDAFMTPAFQKTLTGNSYQQNPDIKSLNPWGKFKELNIEMYRANANLTAGHPYSSRWYAWPFMIRPIYYWHGSTISSQASTSTTTGQESRIYFLGNPVVWWVSTIAALFLLLETLPQAVKTIKNGGVGAFWGANKLRLFLLGSFVLNLLPFIGIKRAMFLYHYLIALIFAIIMLAYLVDRLEKRGRAWTIILILAFAGFIFFAPLSYGLPLDNPAYNLRVWLPTWR